MLPLILQKGEPEPSVRELVPTLLSVVVTGALEEPVLMLPKLMEGAVRCKLKTLLAPESAT